MSENKNFVPYEETHRLRPLLFVTTIVGEGQSDAIVNLNREQECSLCLVLRGKGTAPVEIVNSVKKEIVFSILRADRWPAYKLKLSQRFNVSKVAKGIAFSTPLDAVAGVSIYKMLSNTRLFEKPIAPAGKKGKKKDE
ncbi:MAG: hypothetical protein SPL80_02270 [Bacilli bacterium]|nr:hypothetical protein [Bacilli bacterium]